MDVATHIEALRREGVQMASAVAAAAADDRVPTCPEWTVRDLVHHLGGVQRWATGYVADARRERWDVGLIDVVGSWPDDADLVAWFGQGCNGLAAALEAAPEDLDCWTFLPAPSPRAMWARRQAHETAVHRVDAELATRAPADITAFDPAFATDGVDELLSCFVPRPRSRLRADPPTLLGVTCSDTGATWLLTIGAEGVTTAAAAPLDDASCVVRAAAADLYLALWSRRPPDVLQADGDGRVLERFLETVHVRWS
jgi:uncharacterized protein (TIGR03083 family)